MYTLYVKNGIHSVYIGLNGDEYYDRAKTPEKIKLPLKIHQETALNMMIDFESNKGYKFKLPNKEDNKYVAKNIIDDHSLYSINIKNYLDNEQGKMYEFRTNIGILADEPGYGKTLTCLSIIAANKKCFYNEKNYEFPTLKWQNSSYSGNLIKSSTTLLNDKIPDSDPNNKLDTNLILVKNGEVFEQWKRTIDENTNLKYFSISKTKHISIFEEEYIKIIVKNLEESKDLELISILKNYNQTSTKTKIKTPIKTKNNDLIKYIISVNNPNINILFKSINIKSFQEYINQFDIILVSSTFTRKYQDLIQDILLKNQLSLPIKSYGVHYNRLIIDEPDSIKLPSFVPPKADFTWLITATYHAISYNACQSIKNNLIHGFFESNYHPGNIDKIVIKNDKEYIIKSHALEPFKVQTYYCEAPADVKNAMFLNNNNLLSKENMEKINSGNFDSVIQDLGGDISSEVDIIDLVTKDLKRKISNKLKEKKMIETLDLPTDIKKNKITSIEKQIKSFEEKVSSIEERFSNIEIWDEMTAKLPEEVDEQIKDIVSDKYDNIIKTEDATIKIQSIFTENNLNTQENNNLLTKIISLLDSEERKCAICSDFYTNPVVLGCNHVYCASCIFSWIKKNISNCSCPTCKTRVDLKALNLISNKNGNKNLNELNDIKNLEENLNDFIMTKQLENGDKEYKSSLDKIDTLFKIMKDKNTEYSKNEEVKRGRYLIFSSSDIFFYKIENKLIDYTFTLKQAKGIGQKKAITEFKEGKFDILYLNSQFNAAGIELTECTDIIFLNRMHESIEKQVIGRGQRMGRKTSLNVHYISYDNENKYYS